MGGCRCTYRNCYVRSDGKTHMFHYPVFEKVRCHQWLVNAQRLDFLDLKVSQVKNRVVCQHHFKDECFMNYKRDKLTFDAVPTENGPFCDPSKFKGSQEPKECTNFILLEDIENDFDLNDKKSNFSVKYGDFLTNSEFMESNKRYNRKIINLSNENAALNLNAVLCTENDKSFLDPQNTRLSLPTRYPRKVTSPPMLVVPPYSDLTPNFNILPVQQLTSERNVNEKDSIFENIPLMPSSKVENITSSSNNQVCVKKESKIRILSEKKIVGPITVKGKFEKISPSVNLSLSDKSCSSSKLENKPVNPPDPAKPNNKPSKKLKVLEVLDVEFEPVHKKNHPKQNNQNKQNTDQEVKILPQSPGKKPAQIKNKITPERSAAIEKKRKFNMKLKDIIESCLDKLDYPDPVKSYETSPNPTNNLKKAISLNKDSNVTSLKSSKINKSEIQESECAEEKTLPGSQDSIIAYLEDRMKKMESTLLNKIELNSQQIMDCKKLYTPDSCEILPKRKKLNKKCVATQTNTNENCYKKFLYQEISKYLSSGSNSIIYEELFINKYSHDEIKTHIKRKRRKYI